MFRRGLYAILVAASLMSLGALTLWANKRDTSDKGTPVLVDKDTPQDVMKASNKAVADIEPLLTALKEANAVFSHMGRDQALAAKVLDLARKNDRAGLVALLKRDAPVSRIEVKEIKDFFINGAFSIGSYSVSFCISSKGEYTVCGGRTITIEIT